MPASFPVAVTPFPNLLLDTVMPTLKDSEWRLLCVVVRQTLGWQNREQVTENVPSRKQKDWLTHSQLKAKTGRSSEAVSHALDALVRQGLVEVVDEEEQPLTTPQERRRHTSRLYFRLSARLLAAANTAETTKEATNGVSFVAENKKPDNPSPVETPMPKSEGAISISEVATPKSEISKAKTTKETPDKNMQGAYKAVPPLSVEIETENGSTQENDSTIHPPPNPDVAGFLRHYQRLFQERSPRGEPPPFAWDRDGRRVKGLLVAYGYERLVELLDAFFQSDDAWAKRCGYSLAAFQHLLPTLLMEGSKRPVQREKAALVIYGPSAVWLRAGETASEVGRPRASLFERCPDLARKVQGAFPASQAAKGNAG